MQFVDIKKGSKKAKPDLGLAGRAAP